MKYKEIEIEPMHGNDIEQGSALVSLSMNADEGRWAKKTMHYHFQCQQHGIEDGRIYYIWRTEGIIRGLVGLHHYHWGPEENVWLAWFALHPQNQRSGVGKRMLAAIEKIAAKRGFKKLLVETYEHQDFDKARSFYVATGFKRIGRIQNYLSDDSDMVVYGKEIMSHNEVV